MVCDVGKDAGITVFRDAVISANNTLFPCGFITVVRRYDWCVITGGVTYKLL